MSSIWTEIHDDYIDDNGVLHIDAYTSDDDEDSGAVIAYIINKTVYYRDDRAITDSFAQEVIKENLK